MSTAVLHEDLVGSLTTYWKENFPDSWSTIYPGMNDDASSSSGWVELNIPWVNELTGRENGLQFLRFGIDVHCFSRSDTDLSRIRKIVDAARSTFSQQVVAVRDFDSAFQPAIGFARLSEPEIRDLTRIEYSSKQRRLQHALVSFRGQAQLATV